MSYKDQNKFFFLSALTLSSTAFSANINLPSTPSGSSYFILPGIYGVAADSFF
ncbi:hypothetical protein [Legionella saoudiensis]|uniref:hypothetical protein n=1 Tax=Legionella saoudiensis TaxID=1750561 RepID=UPI000A61F80F|nr:hypothetical protein [Legionella saoudiensis]